MELLFLTPQLPYPPRQGAALRNWGILQELARRHAVHLLSFGAADAPCPPGLASLTTVEPPPQRSIPHRLRDLLLSREPDMARRLRAAPFATALGRLLAERRFDIVQVEGIEMLPYARPAGAGPSRPRWVYDAHNAESELQRSAMGADLRHPARWPAALYSAVQVAKLRGYEAAELRRMDRVVAVSEEDARLLHQVSGVAPLVVPNGIDTTASAPHHYAPAAALRERPGAALVFTGKMDFRPNVDGVLWFVDHILPRLDVSPPPTLWVVGQALHPSLERLRAHPQVVLTGWVEAVEPFVVGADVVVVPLRMGSGTRLKVLQALSLARPVVGTPLGCGGLGLRDGEHARLAETPATFAAALEQTLRDPAGAARLGEQGRAHVRTHFDWQVLLPRLEQSYEALMGAGG